MHNVKFSKCNTISQQIRWTAQNIQKNSMKINLEYLENDSMNNENFGMAASVETNYHISSDEIDRIFDGNAINCTEVKHSISDDSEQLKY